MKLGLIIIIISIMLSSCKITDLTSNVLTKLNSSVKLEEAKSILKNSYNVDKGFRNKTINNKNYSVIILFRKTRKLVTAYLTSSSGTELHSLEYTTQSNIDYQTSPFYIIYEGDEFLFAGYRYEIKQNPYRALLVSIIKTDEEGE